MNGSSGGRAAGERRASGGRAAGERRLEFGVRGTDADVRNPEGEAPDSEYCELDAAGWLALIQRQVQRQCPQRDWDDVSSEAMCALWSHVQAGRAVASITGLVRSLIRTARSRLRRRDHLVEFRDPARLPEGRRGGGSEECSPVIDEDDLSSARLRGRRAHWFASMAAAGWSSQQMAEALQQPLKEVHRQLLRLAARFAAGR